MMDHEKIFAGHDKIAISFSGGKDSLACVYMLRDFKDRITIYHNDTGDLLPETHAIVAHVKSFWPKFVHIQGDINTWINRNGIPSDLIPHSSHFLGRAYGTEKEKLIPRYDCCYINLMMPVFNKIREDGNTLIIRGTKSADMPKLPAMSGAKWEEIEIYLPLQDWSHEQVFEYLRSVGAPISRIYDDVTNGPDCAQCSAWWDEKRAGYLKKYHPALHAGYIDRLTRISAAILPSLSQLNREIEA